jgi:PEP-CTERM motif/Protein of unknown function (DUF642)
MGIRDMTKIFALAALATAAFVATPATAAVNLVTNGGFESTTTASPTGNFEIDTAGTVSGWSSPSAAAYNLLYHSTNANSVAGNAAGTYQGTLREFLWASTASSQGGNFVALDGDTSANGPFLQTLTGLTIGATYDLSFEWGAAQIASRTGATTEQLQVSFGGTTFSTSTLNNASQGFTGWNTVNHSFVATGTTQVLSFLSLGTPNGLPPVALLDNVSLTRSPVPEPATWAMMLVGFGAVGAASRYRRRKTLIAAV